MAYNWQQYRKRQLRKFFIVNLPVPAEKVPVAFAGPIIYAWSRTGNIGRMCRDAIDHARAAKRYDDVTLYNAMMDQLSDWYGQLR